MSATLSDVLSAAKAACLKMVRTRSAPNAPPVEDYEEALDILSKVLSESKLRPAVWAVVLGGMSDILKGKYGTKDW